MPPSLSTRKSLVLCLSGHDPTGGAGLHADIEAVAACGGHALSIITAHTVQDTLNVSRVDPVAPMLLAAQIETLIQDCEINAIKIGLIGDPAQVPAIASAAQRLQVPLVLDPVLRAGGGANLAGAATVAAMQARLFPLTTVLTPNAAEARRLAPNADTLNASAQALLDMGCANVLITGGDEPGTTVTNTWHRPGHAARAYTWPRLPETFHGAGCTLAAAIAALLAQGLEIGAALEQAQAYTHQTLLRARRIGKGRAIPGRLP
jgi:hydroxymethylpyrimidine/phosphomethylpyrimidine kinase